MEPGYKRSHAIVIGINKYKHVSPLGHATNDAEAVAEVLKSQFHFDGKDIRLLLNEDASGPGIRKAFLDFAGEETHVDDRLFVFFAGHGHTVKGRRGEIGYLVPVEGKANDLSTLIRWSDLTNDADLIEAKHVLFVMDACYSGLAINRSLSPGASRFLNDMMMRHSRQVITAGKADEQVSDFGGPRAGHSIFTGHLLDALDGRAASDGILTANGVMAYLYRTVATDPGSQQTPHYGALSGDGDFVFNPPKESADPLKGHDVLISIPVPMPTKSDSNSIETVKSLLAAPEHRIALHRLMVNETKAMIAALESLDAGLPFSAEKFAQQLASCNSELKTLQSLELLLGYWGRDVHTDIITMAPRRLAERIGRDGVSVWLGMKWYPILVLTYSCGMGAIASGQYGNLASLINAPLRSPFSRPSHVTFLQLLLDEVRRMGEGLKTIPAHERHYVPISEYLFTELQPVTDDVLFVGEDYEALFDRLEVFLFLQVQVHGADYEGLGRFAWKHQSRRHSNSPLAGIIAEGTTAGESWEPLKAGLFGGSQATFQEAAKNAIALVERLPWR